MPSDDLPAVKPSTEVSVSATFNIADQSITVTSQDILKLKEQGFKFSLAQPLPLGTPPEMLKWVNKTFTPEGQTPPIDVDAIQKSIDDIPIKSIGTILDGFWNTTLIIEVLNIDTKAGLFEIAILLQPKEDINIFDVLKIESLGFGVKRVGAPDSNPPPDPVEA